MQNLLSNQPILNTIKEKVAEFTNKKATFTNTNLWYLLNKTKTAQYQRGRRALSIY